MTDSTTSTTPKIACCTDCKSPLVRRCWWAFWEKAEFLCDNNNESSDSSCHVRLCKNCHGKRPLLIVGEKEREQGKENTLANATMKHYCRECFHKTSTIDFDKTYIKIGMDDEGDHDNSNSVQSDFVFVYVHGGGSSRQLFYEHALELYKRHGHKAVLLDLPGHGSLVENPTPLTLETCAETLEHVFRESGLLGMKEKKQKVIYVGGSLGAYSGFYLIDKFQHVIDGAILMDCGQNVGPGASLKARLGLRFLKWACGTYSNADLMQMMAGVTKKSKADYKLLETCFGAGMFFEQGAAQVENILQAVAPAEYIPKVPFPILFINGSADYRDSEHKWLEACKNKQQSELHVYEGGDHFFMHDSRFVEDLFQRMHAFTAKV